VPLRPSWPPPACGVEGVTNRIIKPSHIICASRIQPILSCCRVRSKRATGNLVACVFAARTESTPGLWAPAGSDVRSEKGSTDCAEPSTPASGQCKAAVHLLIGGDCHPLEQVANTRLARPHCCLQSWLRGQGVLETVGADPRRLARPARGRADAQANSLRIRATPRPPCPLARRATIRTPAPRLAILPAKFCLYVQSRVATGLWVNGAQSERLMSRRFRKGNVIVVKFKSFQTLLY
jgi:hypothetical protein